MSKRIGLMLSGVLILVLAIATQVSAAGQVDLSTWTAESYTAGAVTVSGSSPPGPAR